LMQLLQNNSIFNLLCVCCLGIFPLFFGLWHANIYPRNTIGSINKGINCLW
jgi:hypothetical protein